MIISSVQLDIGDRSKDERIEYALSMVDRTPPSDLILLPEIWASGFFSFGRYQSESETVEDSLVSIFKTKARERNCHILMGSFVEREVDRYFNTTLLLTPAGDIAARYRKIHLFGYQSDETEILTPGKEVVVVDLPWGRSGFSTCYDLRFPELYRRMTDLGAAFFLIPSAWPHVRLDAWRLFNRARAHENLAFLISCNCAGTNAGSRYAGHSMIVDPMGRVIAEGGEGEEILTVEIDPAQVAAVRKEFPALSDRVFLSA